MAGNHQTASKDLVVAKLTSRVLAGFLDNAIWLSGFSLVYSTSTSNSFKALFGALFPLIYFTVGNSEVMNGQTLGKKLFRVRTQTLDGKLLSLSRSFARFFIAWGIWMLEAAGVGPLYRTYEIAASGIFDLAPLLVNLVLFAVYVPIMFTHARRGLHDFVAGTVVTQAAPQSAGILLQDAKIRDARTLPLSLCLAVALAMVYRIGNLPECDPEITLTEQKYIIENKFNLRMGYYTIYSPFLEIFTEEPKNEEAFRNKTKEIFDYLSQTSETFRPSLPEKLKVIYYFPPENPNQLYYENPLGFEIARDSFEVVSLPPEDLTREKLYPPVSPSNNP